MKFLSIASILDIIGILDRTDTIYPACLCVGVDLNLAKRGSCGSQRVVTKLASTLLHLFGKTF